MFLSIIIPCYNVAEFLPKGIESLKHQTKDIDVEFIFINDGSKDNTLELIKHFASEDSRVIIVDKSNGGVSKARNDALEIARGDYVLFLDGDDYLTDDAVELIYKTLETNKADILIPDITRVDANGCKNLVRDKIPSGKYICEDFFKICSCFPIPPQNIYSRKIIDKHCIRFDETLKAGEVLEFTVSFLRYAESIYVSDISFYYYVMRGSSATHTVNYNNDLTVLSSAYGILYKGEIFCEHSSFQVAVFKLVSSFTFNKYIKYRVATQEVRKVVEAVCNDKRFRRCIKKVAFGLHRRHKERFVALIMFFCPLFVLRIMSLKTIIHK